MAYDPEITADRVLGIAGTGTTGETGATGAGPTGPTGLTGSTGEGPSGPGAATNVAFYTSSETTSFNGGAINLAWTSQIEESNYTLEGSPFELININTTGLYRIHYGVVIQNTNATQTNQIVCDIRCGTDSAGTIQDDINGSIEIRTGGDHYTPGALTFLANLTSGDDIGIRVAKASGGGTAIMGGPEHCLLLEFLR